MSPYFYNKSFGFDVEDVERNNLEIGNDVWVGSNVIITSSCHKIGDGAVIGAGTIVTKDIPPFAIVVGNPGKVLRYRFEEDICNKLLESHWWDFPPEKLMEYYDDMVNPALFAERIISSS